jgi:hypothetical protein
MSDFNQSSNNDAVQEDSLVDSVRVELEEIDASDLSEHAARFDALHQKLTTALNSIDGL